MAKRRFRVLPRLALTVALGGFLAFVLWRYDKFSHARMLHEIEEMRDFFLQFVPVRTVVND